MANINENFLKLENDYLFSEIVSRTEKFKQNNPDKKVISLGMGDVSLPLPSKVIEAINEATQEMSKKETFKGYGKVGGEEFLKEKIAEYDYKQRGIDIKKDEIYVASGSKGDLSGIIELFDINSKVAITNPVYPAYRDANIMAGRENIIYVDAKEENRFIPCLINEAVDIIYLCSPNNPTGVALSKSDLEKWVEYAINNKAIILYDSVYEIYINEENIPHSIYEIDGAKKVAIEFRSYSKNAGFTGVRGSYVVIPNELEVFSKDGEKINLGKIWKRRQSVKFGAPQYIMQKAAESIYTDEGQYQIKENIKYYMENAKYIKEELEKIGFVVYGGINSPYIWLKTPNNMKSWDFFDELLNKAYVVGTPGVGFGKNGEGFFRLTAFSSKEDTIEAVERIKRLFENI